LPERQHHGPPDDEAGDLRLAAGGWRLAAAPENKCADRRETRSPEGQRVAGPHRQRSGSGRFVRADSASACPTARPTRRTAARVPAGRM